jgi:hypothetical protein
VSEHQSKFFEHAATPNLVFVMEPGKTPEQVKEFADLVNAKHAGAGNHYKNMFLGGGTDVKVVGSDLSSLALKDVSGGFETRIAARSRVPAVVLGIREGMGGSALNSGNYAQTRRLWADGWFSPTAQNLCAALEAIMQPAADAELWYDPSEVLFLQEDQKDSAEIMSTNMQAARAGTEAGYKPETVIEAIASGDIKKLVHTGVFSVQLQPPGADGNARSMTVTDRAFAADLLERGWLPVGATAAKVERRDAPTVNIYPVVESPHIHIDNHIPEARADALAPTVTVNVEPTPVTVAAPNVTVENTVPVPTVNVEPTPVTVNAPVTVEPAPVFVADPPKTRRVVRDNKGNITKVVEE